MPIIIKLKGIKRGCNIYDHSSWRTGVLGDLLSLSPENIRHCKYFSVFDMFNGWCYIRLIIRDKLWVFIRKTNGKTMKLYFIDFWFDESGILNVESIAAQRLRLLMRKCKK